MTITVYPNSTDEIKINLVESGIQLCFEAQSGDRLLVELSDEIVTFVIAHLVHYAWDITLEEAFPT